MTNFEFLLLFCHFRLCSLTLTRLVIAKALENELTSVILAIKMQVSLFHFYFPDMSCISKYSGHVSYTCTVIIGYE